VPPPAGNGTIRLTGRCGQPCADAGTLAQTIAAMAAAKTAVTRTVVRNDDFSIRFSLSGSARSVSAHFVAPDYGTGKRAWQYDLWSFSKCVQPSVNELKADDKRPSQGDDRTAMVSGMEGIR
jgi:hypothetical protein